MSVAAPLTKSLLLANHEDWSTLHIYEFHVDAEQGPSQTRKPIRRQDDDIKSVPEKKVKQRRASYSIFMQVVLGLIT